MGKAESISRQRSAANASLTSRSAKGRISLLARAGPLSAPAWPGQLLRKLTPRELEILSLIGQAEPSKEIATLLGVSQRTIEAHRNRLFHKLKLHSAMEAMLYAIENGIVEI